MKSGHELVEVTGFFHYYPEIICNLKLFPYLCIPNGVLAQLVERLNGIQKVSGSRPLISTKKSQSLL